MIRDDIITEALTWEGTPFADFCGVKGAGVDCLHYVKSVFVNVGLINDFTLNPYSPQWFMHRDQPLFLEGLERYAHRVTDPGKGDIAMFNFGRHAAHCAIIIDEYVMIHAYKPVGFVTKDSRAAHAHRLHSYWSVLANG